MKPTLNIELSLTKKMKQLARNNNTNISKLAKNFFQKDVDSEKEPFRMKAIDELPEWVRNFTIAGDPVSDFDHKAEYHKHLEEKYGI